jgi:Putative regulator of cell autolysis
MRLRLHILFLLLLLHNLAAYGQSRFTRDVWLNETNTPVKVNDMTQDELGYTWLATDGGVYRFNGRSYTLMPDSIAKPATAIHIANGRLWVGFSDGSIGHELNGIIIRSVIHNAQPASAITSISSSNSNIVWVTTTEQGFYGIVNNNGLAFNTGAGLSDNFVYKVLEAPNNTIIAATDKGINTIKFNKGKPVIRQYTTADGLPDNIVRTLDHVPGTSTYLAGTHQGGLAVFDIATHTITTPQYDKPWSWGQVNEVVVLTDRKAWVATDKGYMLEVKMYSNQRMGIRPHYMPGRDIRSFVCGPSGMLWCGTQRGATMFPAEYMDMLPMDGTYSLSQATAMTCDKYNKLWLAQKNKLYTFPANYTGIEPLHPALVHTLPADITSLHADEQGRVWIGCLGKGLWYRDENGQLRNVTSIPSLATENVLDIAGTYDRLWVSGLNGVLELSYPGTYTGQITLLRKHNKHSGIGSDYIYQLYPDRKGRMWMATDGAGVCMYDGANYVKWTPAQGMRSKVVYSLTEDGLGNIWASTLGDGVYRYSEKEKIWQQLTKTQGLLDINISTIAANATGQVAVVHSKGLDVWYPQSGQFRNYKLPAFFTDSLSSVLKLYANDLAGNIYLPVQGSIAVFKNIYADYDIRPFVNINNIGVLFKNVPFGTSEFSSDQNHITFYYEGINFANPDRLHYRYKLEGYSDSWIITNDEAVTFPQLSDGDYTFRVQASLNNTFSDKGESVYSFTINRPFWKHWWFILIILAAITGMVWGYVHWREGNLRKLSMLQRERMMFEYEHLKSQVNPHFLFNSLNTLTALIDEDAETAMRYTSQLADLYRNMLSFRDKDTILLAEEWEILENYMYIQQSRFGPALKLVTEIPTRLMTSKRIVPLALQLLVENAIKHNIVSMRTPLTITISADEDTITISNPLQPKMSKEKGAGLGLINIKKRYSLLTKKSITFGVVNNDYTVTLPLL